MNPATRGRFQLAIASLAVAVVACGVDAASQAPPAQKPKDASPDMPTYDIFPPDVLKRDFATMRFAKPLDRPELGFSIAVPSSWDEVPLTISKEEAAKDDEGMVSLALLRGEGPGVRVEVAYCRVAPGIGLETWARAYLDGSGLKLLDSQVGDFSGRQVFDTLVRAPGFLVRMTFSRHGDRIYLVSGSAPESTYRTWAKHLGIAAVSFRTLR
jgi:hypothetical protein